MKGDEVRPGPVDYDASYAWRQSSSSSASTSTFIMQSPRKNFILQGKDVLLDTQPECSTPGPSDYNTAKYNKAVTPANASSFGRSVRLTGHWCTSRDQEGPVQHAKPSSVVEGGTPTRPGNPPSPVRRRAPSPRPWRESPQKGQSQRVVPLHPQAEVLTPRVHGKCPRHQEARVSPSKVRLDSTTKKNEFEILEDQVHGTFEQSLRRSRSAPRGARQRPQSSPPLRTSTLASNVGTSRERSTAPRASTEAVPIIRAAAVLQPPAGNLGSARNTTAAAASDARAVPAHPLLVIGVGVEDGARHQTADKKPAVLSARSLTKSRESSSHSLESMVLAAPPAQISSAAGSADSPRVVREPIIVPPPTSQARRAIVEPIIIPPPASQALRASSADNGGVFSAGTRRYSLPAPGILAAPGPRRSTITSITAKPLRVVSTGVDKQRRWSAPGIQQQNVLTEMKAPTAVATAYPFQGTGMNNNAVMVAAAPVVRRHTSVGEVCEGWV